MLIASPPIYTSAEDSIYTVHTTAEQKAFAAWAASYGGHRRGLTLTVLSLCETSWSVHPDTTGKSFSPFGIYFRTAVQTLENMGTPIDSVRLVWLLDHDAAFAADLAIVIFDWWYNYHLGRVAPASFAWALAVRSYAEGYDYNSALADAYFDKANRWARYLKPKVAEWISDPLNR